MSKKIAVLITDEFEDSEFTLLHPQTSSVKPDTK